ncbi:hypothetical protein [uncultured Tateyamaria sp.]|uniref:hypothetical protein n=1 Tax=Tateyamaria sp. 1078 TaxID=3417464 RepID=UPI00261CCDEB|nr:hypothetical protein [uncultured Tateyamaria sp.]
MKTLLRRARARLWRAKRPVSEVEAAAPLVHLLTEAEPSADLFAQIEARLDGADRPRPGVRMRVVVTAFGAGLCAGALVFLLMQSRQQIVARPNTDAAWMGLGSVTLHGAGLRAFVRTKCSGHTHFLITMHAQSIGAQAEPVRTEIPLMDENEKIRMECIF